MTMVEWHPVMLIGIAVTYAIGFITGYFNMWIKHIQLRESDNGQ